MNPKLIRQFHFTRAERHGAISLLLLAGIAFLWPDVYRAFASPGHTDFSAFADKVEPYLSAHESTEIAPEPADGLFYFDPNTVTAEDLVRLGLTEKVARTIVKYRSRGGVFRSDADLQKIYTLPERDFERLRPYVRIASGSDQPGRRAPKAPSSPVAAAFPFNPNTAGEQDLLRLGLPKSLVGRLLRYREKGGRFRQKEDFRKLYGLKEEDYSRLEPLITLDPEPIPVAASGSAGPDARRPLPSPIDINTATAEAWQTLPGIGPARAQKIVRYRDKLGGFTHAGQVAETYGLPDSVYQSVRPLLHCTAPPFRKINLNTASLEELAGHPYIDFRQARLMVAFREQHGSFASTADLMQIAAFQDQEWLNKILPYLEANAGKPNVK